MENRIIRLEETQKHHAREIKELKNSNKTMQVSFDKLVTNLSAIKNWVIGGVAFAIIDQIGLFSLVKSYFLK
ncbi:hypothetical protein [Sulfurimonas sp.]|uniref:hypothetical protein n=1 Tax=Sulfurimonas sp. TaxID=2022749 RepID=UPI002B45923B|nr:hypothetical protein [Sulfurimonas sp.]